MPSTRSRQREQNSPVLRTRRGDNWFNVAQRAGATPLELMAANPNIAKIRPGQTLNAPSWASGYSQQRALQRNRRTATGALAEQQAFWQNAWQTPAALPSAWQQPVQTTLPDTYLAQQARQPRVQTTLPDTYLAQQARRLQTDALANQRAEAARFLRNWLTVKARLSQDTVWVPPTTTPPAATETFASGGYGFAGGGGGRRGGSGAQPQGGYVGFGGAEPVPTGFSAMPRLYVAGLGLTSWRI